jgi:hypothetical protein
MRLCATLPVPVATNVPGTRVCEHLPLLRRHFDKLTVYHALGIDPGSTVTTMLERPWQICEDKPATAHPGWERWYFLYEQPDGTRVKVSADRDPQTGEWFNPHLSSNQTWP